jgi:hypothetical protein
MRIMIEGYVNACLKILMGCVLGARARIVPPGARRSVAVEAQLAEPQEWLACAYDENFAGRNTKTSEIESQIVLRARAIGKCELAVLLNA